MTHEHIRFEELEAGDTFDRDHVERCPQCRDQARSWELFREVIRRVDGVVPPSDFADRVIQTVGRTADSLWLLVGFTARRWAPFFALAAIAALFFVAFVARPSGDLDVVLTDLAVEAQPEGDLTLDEWIVQLSALEGGTP